MCGGGYCLLGAGDTEGPWQTASLSSRSCGVDIGRGPGAVSLLLDHVIQNSSEAQRMRRAGAAWPGAWGASHEGRVGEGKGEQAEALGRQGL